MTMQAAAKESKKPATLKSGTNLERVLAAGHFAVYGEIGPPKSFVPL